MHAIILAGGFGTRLRPSVTDVPKPLAPIGGKPFLAWLTGFLITQGVTGFTLSLHYDWQKIRDYFTLHPLPVPVDYRVEETPLGTGGAIRHALSHCHARKPVLVMNGDSFIKLDYRALYALHCSQNAKLTVALRKVSDGGRYGSILEKNGVITSFTAGEPGKPALINAGVYVMQPDLFSSSSLPASFSFERDFLPPRLGMLKPLSFPSQDYFIDIGIPSDYDRACKELPDIFSQ